ncbi:MAG TPA: PKD domain-containing protein, partial [Thermoplasmata archaeon]|nr:PKD domain-containing protein [Thermoplasmata archaeon]
MERAYEKIVGSVLIALGVAILLVGFSQAYELYRSPPSVSSTSASPTAAFSWSVSGFSVTFTDNSVAGSSSISSSYWNFGDGNATYATNTVHDYSSSGTFNVSLEVQDTSGAAAETYGFVHAGPGSTSSGQSSPSTTPGSLLGGLLGGLNFGSTLSSGLTISVTFAAVLLEWLIGGSILKAGWNLITPKA